jgi:hypothetical protein
MENFLTTTVETSQNSIDSRVDIFSFSLSPVAFLSFQHLTKNTVSFSDRIYATKPTYLHINSDNNIRNVCI